MPPKSRQQRRARSRGPSTKRRGATAFLVFMLLILLGGGALVAIFRANPPPLTRGASAGEHWHAAYKFYICGKRMNPYPSVEGEIHSHGDGFMHIHPRSPAYTGDNANLRSFLLLYETSITQDAKGNSVLTFPDGKTYKDGDTCPKDKKKEKHDLVVTNKGKRVDGDPGALIAHDGDSVEIRFGPKGEKPFANPYAKARGLPDPGAVVTRTPVPDSAPEPAPEPETEDPDAEEEDPEATAEATPEES